MSRTIRRQRVDRDADDSRAHRPRKSSQHQPVTATPTSWVIRDRTTRAVLFETWNRRIVDALNTTRYEAVPIGTYLAELNTNIREGRR